MTNEPNKAAAPGPRPNHSPASIARSYRGAKRSEELYGEWGAALVFRPLSFLVTPLFLKAGFSATGVSLLALCLLPLLPVAAIAGGTLGYAYIAAIGIIFATLDCVDGNIARVTDTASKLGGYTDFIADILFRVVFYSAIGLIVAGQPFPLPYVTDYSLAVALIAAWLAVTARLSRVYTERGMDEGNPYAAPESEETAPKISASGYLFAFVSGLDPLLPVVVLVTGYFGWLPWVLVWLVLYSALDFLYTQFTVARRLR
jgi:phosphatidylglycerophosphate synthase